MADPGIITRIVFFLILLVSVTLNSVQAAPTTELQRGILRNSGGSDNNQDEYEYEYDQRQNGTENYRISVKDVVIIWAPANPLLAATALLDAEMLGAELFGGSDNAGSEKPQSEQDKEKPAIIIGMVEEKPAKENSTTVSSIEVAPTTETAEQR